MTTLNITNYLDSLQGRPTRACFSSFDKRMTYARILDSKAPLYSFFKNFQEREFQCFWGSKTDDFVKRYFLSPNQPSRQGLNLVEKLDSKLTNFEYAIGKICNKELVDKLTKCGIQHVVNEHFDAVDVPWEGDLVVYYKKGDPVHAGIFRKQPDPHNQGHVESTWCTGFENLYVFQHDFFHLPSHLGRKLKIFRFNPNVAVKENRAKGRSMSIQKKGQFHFDPSEANKGIRKKIDQMRDPKKLLELVPEIQRTDIIFLGRCHKYALTQILPQYEYKDMHQKDLFGTGNSKILSKYFTPTADPKTGDLAVYSDGDYRKHFGIYIAPDLIESKWGPGGVYRHPPFCVESSYGDIITYYRLNDDAQYNPDPEIDLPSFKVLKDADSLESLLRAIQE